MSTMSLASLPSRPVEGASVALAAIALATGMALGGMSSPSALAIVQLVALVAAVAALAAMMVEGRWRLAQTPIWLFVGAVVGVAALQLAPRSWLGPLAASTQGPLSAIAPSLQSVTVRRQATLDWIGGAAVGVFLMFITAHHLRSLNRLQLLCVILATVSVVTGVIGAAASLTGRDRAPFGILKLSDPKTPAIVEDLFAVQRLSGLGPSERLLEPFETDGAARARTTTFFAGFPSAAPWSACAVALAPLLLAAALARNADLPRWLAREDARGALPTLIVCHLLVGGAAWFDDLGSTVAGVAAATLAGGIVAGAERWRFIGHGVALVATATAVSAGRGAIAGASPFLLERWELWQSDNLALFNLFKDHAWLGGGFGAVGELLPLYRSVPAEIPLGGSSLLVLACEGGLAVVAIISAGAIVTALRWRRVRWSRSADERVIAAGLIAGLAGLVGAGIVGMGLESPVVLVLGFAILGGAARAIEVGIGSVEPC